MGMLSRFKNVRVDPTKVKNPRVGGTPASIKLGADRQSLIDAIRKTGGKPAGKIPTMYDNTGGGARGRGGAGGGVRRSSSSSTLIQSVGGRPLPNPGDAQIDAEARSRFADQFAELARQRAISGQMDVNRNAWFNEYRNRIAAINAANQNAYQQAAQSNQALAGLNVPVSDSSAGAAAAQQRNTLLGSFGSMLAQQKANETVAGGGRLGVADLKDIEAQNAERAQRNKIAQAYMDMYTKERDWKTQRKSDLEAAAAKAALEQAVLGNNITKTKNDLLIAQGKLKSDAAKTASKYANDAAKRKADAEQRAADRELKRQQLAEQHRHNVAGENKKSAAGGISPKDVRKYRLRWYETLELVKRDVKSNGERTPKDISRSIVENPRFKGVDPFMAEAAAAYVLYGGVLKPTARKLKGIFGLNIKVRRDKNPGTLSSDGGYTGFSQWGPGAGGGN